ncbi:MAG TPA: response regulator [Blastocatellia bacterium]|nr:response regulator [Blastocatellia bacterium]
MDWMLPDISIILATITIIFFIFLRVGRQLQVKETFFQLWVLAWLLSIVHYGGQLARAGAGARWGQLVDALFLAYSGITFVAAAESLRGRNLRKMLPYCVGVAALFTLWAVALVYKFFPQGLAPVRYGYGLGVIFGLAGVSHWLQQRRHRTIGAAILAYSFFFWAACFFVLTAMAQTAFVQNYIQYLYQFSNLPKPIAAISMLIFLLEGEKVNAQRQRDFSENLIENAPDGIFIVDLDANVTRVNKQFEALCGCDADHLLGKPLNNMSPDSEGAGCEHISRVFGGEAASYQSKLAAADGTARDVLVTNNPIYDGGRIVGAMGIVKDVTERIRLEQQLRQSEKMASIGLLVSGVAHELNNPLTSVIGFTELALGGQALPDATKGRLNIVLSEARRTRSIVQKLLSAVRQQKSQRLPVYINNVIRETIALREFDFMMNNITIKTDLASDIPLVVGDPADIQQVLINLMQNAFDAISETGNNGLLAIRTRCESGQVIIEIINDGPPISAPERVFDPFYTTKEVGKGTGLGLSICYQVVKSLGGEIAVENLPQGVTFTIRLSASGIRLSSAPDNKPDGGETAHGRILVVDDEPAVLALCKDILSAEGFAVETASSGVEAIEKLRRSNFDVILTDYKMPERVSGADVYNWVRENRTGQEARIIFITGDAVNPDTYRFLNLSGSPVVFKPFDSEELVAKIKGTLSGTSSSAIIRPSQARSG